VDLLKLKVVSAYDITGILRTANRPFAYCVPSNPPSEYCIPKGGGVTLQYPLNSQLGPKCQTRTHIPESNLYLDEFDCEFTEEE